MLLVQVVNLQLHDVNLKYKDVNFNDFNLKIQDADPLLHGCQFV